VSRPPLLVLVGPTGVGKTAVAVRLARQVALEVVGADSRQVYRGMDIGTGKPTADERAAVPHHLIDVVDPDERSAAAGVTGVARTTGAAVAPLVSAPLMVNSAFWGLPFVLAGSVKIVYDLLLYRAFRAIRPPEEGSSGASRVSPAATRRT